MTRKNHHFRKVRRTPPPPPLKKGGVYLACSVEDHTGNSNSGSRQTWRKNLDVSQAEEEGGKESSPQAAPLPLPRTRTASHKAADVVVAKKLLGTLKGRPLPLLIWWLVSDRRKRKEGRKEGGNSSFCRSRDFKVISLEGCRRLHFLLCCRAL